LAVCEGPRGTEGVEMAESGRRTSPNRPLIALLEQAGPSREGLARRINALAAESGLERHYTHTSVQNWAQRGMIPTPPIPRLLAQALSEYLSHPITLGEIGMTESETAGSSMGLDFPRELAPAVRNAVDLWSDVERRNFLASASTGTFAVAAYNTPLTRWLINPADDGTAHRGTGRTVGAADVASLRAAADQARRWDSQYGGGDWRTAAVARCLHHQAAPLLRGTYTEVTGRPLFAATAELSRVAGFAYFDAGHHRLAQAHLIQALRLARAAGDAALGGYVLATMALQTLLRGYTSQAIDMAQAATHRAGTTATPRAVAFYKLIEGRAHARAADSRAAERALAAADQHLSRATPEDPDPAGLDYMTPERLAADATEIYRDLRRPDLVHQWDAQARRPTGYTRSTGMRAAIVASAHIQAKQLDEGIHRGQQALTLLATVHSHRAKDYIRGLLIELRPWEQEPQVREYARRASAFLAA
jgi:hypothetical protein